MRNKQRGITLIALIITIIVLLILAGVTIAMIVGDNGILNQAINAREQTQLAREQEENVFAQYEELLNNGTNLSGDEEEVTDDIWKISKDITGKTSKVNIYLESIYYKPSFKEFFAREFSVWALENAYGLAFYDETDGVDFWFDLITLTAEYDGTEDEFLEEMGYDSYSEYEKMTVYSYSYGLYDVSDELSNQEQIEQIRNMIQENEELDSEYKIDVLKKYEEIVQQYEQQYSSVLEMPETIKNKEYTIIKPDGSFETYTGEELITNRVRVPVNENGEYNFVINSADNYEKGYNITISNIGDYIVEIGDYIYTYNCVPALPFYSYNVWQKVISELNIDMNITDYRLNFNGWNAYAKDDTKTEYEEILEEVNGEKVTAMYGTYAGCTNLTGFTEEKFAEYQESKSNDITDMYKNINIKIPNTVTNMVCTFCGASNLIIAPIIPERVENMYQLYMSCENLKIVAYEHMSGQGIRYWITSDYPVQNNLNTLFLLENSEIVFGDTILNEKIKRYNYDTNGDFYTDEDVVVFGE